MKKIVVIAVLAVASSMVAVAADSTNNVAKCCQTAGKDAKCTCPKCSPTCCASDKANAKPKVSGAQAMAKEQAKAAADATSKK